MALPQNFTTIRPVLRSARVDLTGAVAVTLVLPPPRGETFLLRRINGVNSTAGVKVLTGFIVKDNLEYNRFRGSGAASGFPYTARLVNQPGPHDHFAVLTSTDTGFQARLSGTGTDPIQLDYEVVPAGAHDNAKKQLNGTTWVEILAAPPRGTTFAIRGGDGNNTVSASVLLDIAVLKGGKYYYLHTMQAAATSSWGFQSEGARPRNPNFIGCLDDTDESLVVKTNNSNSNSVVSVDYDIINQ